MKKQIKRCAFILPIVFMLLMSCVSFSSVLAADDVDYSSYILDSDGIEDFDSYFSVDYFKQLISSTYTNINFSNSSYFLSVEKIPSNYDALNPYNYNFNISLFFINDLSPVFDNDYYIAYNNYYQADYIYKSDHTFGSGGLNGGFYFVYSKQTGQCYRVNSSDINTFRDADSVIDSDYRVLHYIYAQDTDLEDFPIADVINQGGGNGLNVEVEFTPDLTGLVQTSRYINGVYSDSQYFSMHIANLSSTGIQFFMGIVDHNTVVFDGNNRVYNSYSDNVRFVYSSDEWVNEVSDYDLSGTSTYIPSLRRSEWHLVQSDSIFVHNFSWSQMQLYKDSAYDVVVYAIPNDNTYVDSSLEWPAYDWSQCVEVYRSSFSLASSTKYDPNNNSFGNYPNKSGDAMNHGSISAYVDDNGKVQTPGEGKSFSREDIKNSATQGSYVYSGSGGSISSDINSLSGNFNSFFSFINRVFSFFPRSFQSVITVGLTSIVVLGVLKVVIK